VQKIVTYYLNGLYTAGKTISKLFQTFALHQFNNNVLKGISNIMGGLDILLFADEKDPMKMKHF
jgi:hypothetical protein